VSVPGGCGFLRTRERKLPRKRACSGPRTLPAPDDSTIRTRQEPTEGVATMKALTLSDRGRSPARARREPGAGPPVTRPGDEDGDRRHARSRLPLVRGRQRAQDDPLGQGAGQAPQPRRGRAEGRRREGTKLDGVGKELVLARGVYHITMVGQAPDDNHLKLVVTKTGRNAVPAATPERRAGAEPALPCQASGAP